LLRISELSGYPPYLYITIDAGDRHSGVQPGSPELPTIFQQIEQVVLKDGTITVAFVGLYCGANSSLGFDNGPIIEALTSLESQLEALIRSSPVDELRLSIPATPISTYIPQLLQRDFLDQVLAAGMDSFKQTLNTVYERKHRIEVRSFSP
jgi:hypothetical protein